VRAVYKERELSSQRDGDLQLWDFNKRYLHLKGFIYQNGTVYFVFTVFNENNRRAKLG